MNKKQTKIILFIGIILILGLFFWGTNIYQRKENLKKNFLKYDNFLERQHKDLFKECANEYLGYVLSGITRGTEGICSLELEAVHQDKNWFKYFKFYAEPLIGIQKGKINIFYLNLSEIMNRQKSLYEFPRLCIKSDVFFEPAYAEILWMPSPTEIQQDSINLLEDMNLQQNIWMMGQSTQTFVCLSEKAVAKSFDERGKLLIGIVGIPILEGEKEVASFDVLAIPSPETSFQDSLIGQNNVLKYSSMMQIMKNIRAGLYEPPSIYQINLPIK